MAAERGKEKSGRREGEGGVRSKNCQHTWPDMSQAAALFSSFTWDSSVSQRGKKQAFVSVKGKRKVRGKGRLESERAVSVFLESPRREQARAVGLLLETQEGSRRVSETHLLSRLFRSAQSIQGVQRKGHVERKVERSPEGPAEVRSKTCSSRQRQPSSCPLPASGQHRKAPFQDGIQPSFCVWSLQTAPN